MKRIQACLPFAVVFLTSMGIMILELAASRLVAKYLGNSLYTWTGVIGIVLGGISLGNSVGGRLADRFEAERLAAPLLLLSSLSTFLILVLDLVLGRIMQALGYNGMTLAALTRTILVIAVLFFLPSTALGTISPVMAKYALKLKKRVGRTVGNIYAFGALGSIVGTFLTGFLLIPLFGTTRIVLMVGALLALLAVLLPGVRLASSAWITALAVLLALGVFIPTAGGEIRMGDETRRLLLEADSAYSHLRVEETASSGPRERILKLDALVHNRYNPEDPDNLLYDYEKIFDAVTRSMIERRPSNARFSTLTLGGGACLYPSYLARHFPAGRHEIVEIDPEVIRTASRFFDFPTDGRIPVHIMDARAFVGRELGRRRFDFIYGDAFNSFSIPHQLTTRQFAEKLRGMLEPSGIYLVNCIDMLEIGGFLAAFLKTLEEVFPCVSVYQTPGSTSGRRSTFILAASALPIEEESFTDSQGRPVAERLGDDVLQTLKRRWRAVPLTDDYAPVENLIAPLYLQAVRR